LDTAQHDLLEAQASSGKATPSVTAQHALSEAQASSVKAPFFVHAAVVATSQWAIETGSVHFTHRVLLGRRISVTFRLADTVVRFRYCVQKIAIFTMVVACL
jgi:hypothetical protein